MVLFLYDIFGILLKSVACVFSSILGCVSLLFQVMLLYFGLCVYVHVPICMDVCECVSICVSMHVRVGWCGFCVSVYFK